MKNNNLSRSAFGLLIGLCVQLLLGMWAYLFVSFPDSKNENELWHFAGTQLPVILHIIVGTLLVLGSLMLFIRAVRAKQRLWQVSSGIGFGAVILAWVSGREFVSTQSDPVSLAMAAFFVLAVIAYLVPIYVTASGSTKPGA
jgi:uncharacterized BrkB/YihY/UPF0761 family membrane protein